MSGPLLREFRLSSKSDVGVRCDNEGAFVGTVPLLRRSGDSWTPGNEDELSVSLSQIYGLPVDISKKRGGLTAIARALNEGDVARAQIAALQLQLPDPPRLAKEAISQSEMIRLAVLLYRASLLKIDWSEDEHPRWPAGSPDGQGGQFAPKGEGGDDQRDDAGFAQDDSCTHGSAIRTNLTTDTLGESGDLLDSAAYRNKPTLSARDKAYLDKYYLLVLSAAGKYDVDPALILGVGIESGFASRGTYLRSNDAFGLTGGSPKGVKPFRTAQENVDYWFRHWGPQVAGAKSDVDTFLNGLLGKDPDGNAVPGWKVYNVATADWSDRVRTGIRQMQRDLPLYLGTTEPI